MRRLTVLLTALALGVAAGGAVAQESDRFDEGKRFEYELVGDEQDFWDEDEDRGWVTDDEGFEAWYGDSDRGFEPRRRS